MGNVLVFLQPADGTLPKAALVALRAAGELKQRWNKDRLIGIIAGSGASKIADDALEYGLDQIYYCEDAALEKYLAVPYAALLQDVFTKEGCDTLVGTSTTTAKDLFPRVAAKLDAGQASDVIGVEPDGSLRRPMYAGNVFACVEITTALKVVTVRQTAFVPADKVGKRGTKTEVKAVAAAPNAGEVISYEFSKSERPELADAEIVVSGGRAMQSAENFQKYIFPLADSLGAAVGASRAAVDSGYAPNDWQVGQTGKVVAPSLYVAVGISGAIQHLAGMKDSKVIVAINKDPDAPIYEVADYGLVADLYEAVPQLTEAIKKAKA